MGSTTAHTLLWFCGVLDLVPIRDLIHVVPLPVHVPFSTTKAPEFDRVEDIPFELFIPPHCPDKDCPTNRADDPVPFTWRREKPHARKSAPFLVPRFACRTCGRSFCQMTFAATYWLKRPELLERIAPESVASSSHRAIGRTVGCAGTTVTRQLDRLGRHSNLLHCLMLQARPPEAAAEPVNFDDFETFATAQFYALAVGTAVTTGSGLVLDLEPASHARGGKLNPWERAERDRLYEQFGPPPRGQRNRAFRHVLDRLLAAQPAGTRLTLITDDHSVYAGEVARHPGRDRIDQRRFPNPKRGPKRSPRSREARERDAAMFETDTLHALIRHCSAAHRRETPAFARRVPAEMGRLFLFVVWRNLVKNRSERRPWRGTAAMQAGITRRRWRWRDVLRRRLFPWHVDVPESWLALYRREVSTPGAPPQPPFRPRFVD